MLVSLARLVTARPWITLLVLLLITVALGYGAVHRAPPPETRATLPQGSAVAEALHEIEELFRETGEANVVTLLFRGDALSPGGLAQMESLVNEIVSDPKVAEVLAPGNSVVAPSLLVMALLQVPNFDSVSQADIDNLQGPPEMLGAIDALTGEDTDGTPVAIATIRVLNTGDERVEEAERRILALARADQGPLEVTSVSPVIVEDEYVKATEEGMAPLVGLAFLLIAALILLFMRTISDLLLTLIGLLMSIIWIVGAEGWLGPNALGLTGPPNSLTTMVPIIIIGLTVDYAIQIVSHYREQRNAGENVLSAVRVGFRNVAVPLILAAITTIVSLLASLFSPIEIVGDFGIIAGLGVGMSLIVMLTLVPAGRTIIDRRREARGRLNPPRPIASALPGVSGLAELLGRSITRAPGPYLVGVLVVTAALGYAATDLESEFSIRDILPRGGDLLADMNTLDAAVGGSTEMATVLLKAEATETRTLLNIQDLTAAFQDERRRPAAAAGPIHASFDLLLRDWIEDSNAPGDNFDPELADLFRQATVGVMVDPVLMQQFIDQLEARDPAVKRMLINDPQGIDTLLVQFPTYSGDPGLTKLIQSDIEGLWFGDDAAITATSESIISITVTDSITERQTEAITTTILAALTVLAVFFWITVRQPGLAVIAVGPIVLVLISVLGTMALLGIPYTIITSIITALSIGIGVDYTIHMIHRYREEYSVLRDPEQAAVRTLATTGSALLGSALTTALGLGVLVVSPLAASQQFGFTAAITIGYSLIVSILVVPAAMTFWGAYQNMKLRSNVRRWAEELDREIEAIHLRQE
ncbi:MAG: MMPL family transporter [Chloroflexota bacterium]|nr:MMPL family transporter [Chloroflexota bacterium]